MSRAQRWYCQCCERTCTDAEVLRAPNPFAPERECCACPHCKEIGELVGGCDVSGCNRPSNCGTPTPEGYRVTCDRHAPRLPIPT
ncbi:MAG TPA: hypothetical protein VGD46_19500 [Rhizobacter sp.]